VPQNNLGSKEALAEFAQLQERVAHSIEAAATREEAIRELSPTRQLRQHVAVSVIVFIVSYTLTFYLIKPSTFWRSQASPGIRPGPKSALQVEGCVEEAYSLSYRGTKPPLA
jgi:hypothetical protein